MLWKEGNASYRAWFFISQLKYKSQRKFLRRFSILKLISELSLKIGSDSYWVQGQFLHYVWEYIVSRCSMMFCWELEGRDRHRHYTAIAPFWFSTEHRWIVITPFWLSTDDIRVTLARPFFPIVILNLLLAWARHCRLVQMNQLN